MNDSWTIYQAVSPATAVFNYNGNPTIAKLYTEIVSGWMATAMSTDKGKLKRGIPAQVSFPDGVLDGTNSPNWYTVSHPREYGKLRLATSTIQRLLLDFLFVAYNVTGDTKYLEPIRLEYELAVKPGYIPDPVGPFSEVDAGACQGRRIGRERKVGRCPIGTDQEVTHSQTEARGTQGASEEPLEQRADWRKEKPRGRHLRTHWPISTSEAGPTDRVGFIGIIDPFFIYACGSWGGPLLTALL